MQPPTSWTVHAARFVIATAVYTLTGWGALAVSQASGNLASIWVANALILGYAVRRPPRELPVLLAGVIAGAVANTVLTGRPAWLGVPGGLANVVEVGLIYGLFRHCGLRPATPMTDRELVVFLVVSVLLAPAVSAVFGASVATLSSAVPWHRLFIDWWVGDALGMFVVLPVVWMATPAALKRLVTGRAAVEFWSWSALTVVVAVFALTRLDRPASVMALPLLLLAVRVGVVGTSLGNLLMMAVALVVVTMQHRGVLPPPGAQSGGSLSDVWLTACLSAIGPLFVAFMAGQRDSERIRALKLNDRLRAVADNLPAYIAELGPDLRYRYANAKYQQWLDRDPETLIGLRPEDVLGEAAAAALAPYMERALGGEPQLFEFDAPTGQRLEVHYEPLRHSGGMVLMAHDITWRHEAERRFRHLLESAPDAMLVLDRATRRIILVNAQVERTFGYRRDELLGHSLDRLLLDPGQANRDTVDAHLAAQGERGAREVLALTGVRHDGTTLPVEVMLSPLQGEGAQLVATLRDVSARRRTERALHEERERAQVTLRSIGDAVITYDTAAQITSLNPVAEALTGWARADALGRPYTEVVRLHDPETGAVLTRDGAPGDLISATDAGVSAVLRRRDGRECYVEESDSPIRDSDGTVIGGVTVLRDISEAHAMRQRMAYLAQHDYLTGLPNRVLLEHRLEQALERIDEGARGALLFLDLDLFKHINDSLGHHTGDRVLQAVAERLVDAVRPEDTVSRQGGDEFVLLLHVDDAAQAGHTAAGLIRLIEAPIMVDGRALHLSASIGIALFPDDSRDLKTLVKQADTALYHAKQAGRGRCSHFTSAMSERADQRLRLETELRTGISAGQLFLVYQPKLMLPSRRIAGIEALVRWRRGDGRVVPPLEFIPIAEETGLITAIDDWVLHEACRQARAWLDAGIAGVPVAVNLSLARLAPDRVIESLQRELAESRLPPELLEVEFTESQMLGQHARAAQLVDRIRGLGVRLAVDDFGTGYSSLSYLTNYRFDTIKVDRSFVEGLPFDVERAAVVQAIVGIARTLRCSVVAEGVETDAQADALIELGCRQMQGYLFSRPLPVTGIEPLLRAGHVPVPAPAAS